ncbi:MAG: hypothetical protein KF754_08560 [Planctomycetes bacterium]|nr:hypothetical protein [Planctomycetota bacterium]
MTLLLLFLATTALGVAIIALGLRAGFEGRARLIALSLLGFWLALTGAVAAAGLLAPAPDKPPPNMALALTGTLTLGGLALTAPGKRMAQRIAGKWVVGMQAFRIPVEVCLWLGAETGVSPVLMSWHGRNFDVINGVLGLWMARRAVPRPVLVAFHLLGLALVFNVAGHAIAATPGPLQQIHGAENVPMFVTTFPYVWLPALLVPLAIAGHILGLRQLAQGSPAKPPA